ncbi:MAG: ABC transporter permease [Dehalococcoidia bacterium]|nr:ABC transporter permease [Dehalococcoidia bacterium]
MQSITAPLVFIGRRVCANWRFLLVLFAGILLAVTLLAATPLYLGATAELGLRYALRYESQGVPDVTVILPSRPLDESRHAQASRLVADAAGDHIRRLVTLDASHIRTPALDLDLPGAQVFAPGEIKANLESFSGYEEHTRLVQGAFPRSTGGAGGIVEVAIGQRVARLYRIAVGDSLTVYPVAGDRTRTLRARVTAIVDAGDPSSAYWSFTLDPFNPQSFTVPDGEIPVLPLLMSHQGFLVDTAATFRGMLVDYWWFYAVDTSRISARDAVSVRAGVTTLERGLPLQVPGATVLTGLGKSLDSYQNKLFFTRIPILVIAALVTALVLFYLIIVANVVVERHLGEIALLRSRGANAAQVMAVYLWEALFMSLAALLLGPLLARAVIPLLGKTPPFHDVSGGALLPVDISPAVAWAALAAAVLSFLALAIPAMRGAGFNVLHARAAASRPARLLFFHRYFLDIFFFALSGLLYWEMTKRGSLVTQRLFGENSVDYVLIAAPVLFMVSAALLAARALPWLIMALAWLAARGPWAWLSMALWDLARSPAQYLRPVVLLTLVAGMAMFAASYNLTVQRGFQDRAAYFAGADARLAGLPRTQSGDPGALADALEKIPGAERAAAAYRPEESGGFTAASGFDLLAVDPIRINRVAFYRDDFSDQPLFNLLAQLGQGRALARGRDLPEGATGVGIWVRPSREMPNASLWVRLRDEQGRSSRHTLGRLGFEDWRFLRAAFPPLAEGKYAVESLYVWENDFPDTPFSQDSPLSGFTSSGQVNFHELRAFTAAAPAGELLDAFTQPLGWRVLATNATFREKLEAAPFIRRTDQPSLQLSWQAAAGTGIRGIFPSADPDPLPILAGERYLAATGRRVTDVVTITVGGVGVPVKIAGSLAYFPTLDPKRPFLLGNVDTLLHYANLFRGQNPVTPNEAWISVRPGARDLFIRSAVAAGLGPNLLVRDDAQLKLEAQDPLVGGGSRAVLFATLLVLIVVAIGGYVGYFYVASYRAPQQFAVLRALGMAPRHMLQAQVLTHAAIVLGAALLGAWIGLRTHGMMITFLKHTEAGREVLPPFLPQADWTGVRVVLLASLAALSAVVAAAVLTFIRIPISRVLRRGEG